MYLAVLSSAEKNTHLHLHATDLSRCTDRNSSSEESKWIEVHLGQDGRRSTQLCLAEVDILRDLMCPGGSLSHQTFSFFSPGHHRKLSSRRRLDMCACFQRIDSPERNSVQQQ